MLYTAKGTASLLVPLASVLSVATGNWTAALSVAAFFNIIAAVMAIAVLYPARLREIKKAGGPTATMVAAPVV
jgi:OFA family oxalate/formate antiporter-like MFS transporter